MTDLIIMKSAEEYLNKMRDGSMTHEDFVVW